MKPAVDRAARAALRAMATGDLTGCALFTDDVAGSSPMVEIQGKQELRDQLGDYSGGLTNVDVQFDAVEGDDTDVVVRWRLAVDHTGELLVNEDALYDPTGRHLAFGVVSHLTFREGRICAYRHEYDMEAIRAQLR